MNNSAGWSGGALYVEGFEYDNDIASVTVDSAVTIANNTAQKGGGICVRHCEILCSGFCSLLMLGNSASFGGGMYAEFSHIKIDCLQLNITIPYSTDHILFFRNLAIKGGGLYLFNSTISDYKLCANHTLTLCYYNFITVKFTQNSAERGGAIYSNAHGLREICIFQQYCHNVPDHSALDYGL